MTAVLPLNLLFLVLLFEVLQVHGTSIPISRSHSYNKEWPSNMCTSNLTIPTVSEGCIASCSSMQRAQTICRDNTLCMCSIARPPDLEACFDCILEGIGTFVDSIPHYIESLQHQTSVYTASCEQVLEDQSIILNPNVSEAARQMISLCSVDNSRHSHQLAEFTNAPSSFHSDFYKLFPIFSFTLAIVLLLIGRLHNLTWKAIPLRVSSIYLLITITIGPSYELSSILFSIYRRYVLLYY